jgi:hypothetical protein
LAEYAVELVSCKGKLHAPPLSWRLKARLSGKGKLASLLRMQKA